MESAEQNIYTRMKVAMQPLEDAFLEEVACVNAAIISGARVFYIPTKRKGERRRKYRIKAIEWEKIDTQLICWFVCRGQTFNCSVYQTRWPDILQQAGVQQRHPPIFRFPPRTDL